MIKVIARELKIGISIEYYFSQFWHILSLYLSHVIKSVLQYTEKRKQFGKVDFIIKLWNIRFIVE